MGINFYQEYPKYILSNLITDFSQQMLKDSHLDEKFPSKLNSIELINSYVIYIIVYIFVWNI
jgi:hypothetical protein